MTPTQSSESIIWGSSRDFSCCQHHTHAHCCYLAIYISRKIRLCIVDFRANFKPTYSPNSSTFWSGIIIVIFHLFCHRWRYFKELTGLNCNICICSTLQKASRLAQLGNRNFYHNIYLHFGTFTDSNTVFHKLLRRISGTLHSSLS